jgi:TRAP-type mannitol/chloroaromatic compound transport system permease small subunit
MNEAVAAKGVVPYMPLLFWAGIAIYVASLVLNFRYGASGPGEDGASARMQRLLIPVDRVSTFVGKAFAWSIVLLTFAISYEVFSRYAFGRPTSWAFDASYILYGALFIMAGAYALSRNGHVRGDFLYRTWRPRVQAGMDLLLYFVAFFPGILAFIYSGYAFSAQSFVTNEHSAYSPAGPPIYHYKMLIPMTGILLLLQGIVEVIRCIACLRTGVWPQRLNDVEELEKVILLEKAGDHT